MIRQSAPFKNGTANIAMGDDAVLAWHEIALSFQKADGSPYGVVTGSATMAAIGTDSDILETGANPLDLATEHRWAPFMSGVSQINVTIAGAPADAFCVASVTTSP